MTVFIYGLYDPRNENLRYIGKTLNGKIRLALHLCEKHGTHKNNWLAQLKAVGLKPEMRVLETIENSDDHDWQRRERWWIAKSIAEGHDLTNLDSGGRSGMKKSAETRAKQSASAKGRTQSAETRAKISASKRAAMTPELRDKSRQRLLRRKQTPEMIEARRAGLMGRVVSAETRRKISEAHRGMKHSEEARAKIRAARALQVITPETRAKLSAVAKGRKPSPQTIAASIAASTGRLVSEETRARMRASRAAYFSRKWTVAA